MGTEPYVNNGNIGPVYASHFMSRSMPRGVLPQEGMPREVAYQLIMEHLALDGNPSLNLASFVSTYMEEEAEKLMVDAFPKSGFEIQAYQQTADIERRCINILASMYHASSDGRSHASGARTVGSSEAIILGVLALKVQWANKRKVQGKDCSRPNMIMSAAVQVCWKKALLYFEVEPRYVYCTTDRFVIDPIEAINLVDENTIGICCILGSTYTGQYEDIKAVNDMLVTNNLYVPIHVDAASGGFVASFVSPGLEWDFRLERVVSINVSGHKYGLVYPGVGWVIWRDHECLPNEMLFRNHLMEPSKITFNSSKGSSQILGQYYQLIRLGKRGYKAVMDNAIEVAGYLSSTLQSLDFIIMSDNKGNGLPLVAFRFASKRPHGLDEFALSHELRARGWMVPAYTMAAHASSIKLLRIVCRNDFSRSRCDTLIMHVKAAVEKLDTIARLIGDFQAETEEGKCIRQSTL